MSLDLVSFANLAISKSCSWSRVLCKEYGHPDGQRPLSLSQSKLSTAGSASGNDSPSPGLENSICTWLEPFSIPLIPPQPGTGSSYTKAQKGSWVSQHVNEPFAARPPATRYLASGSHVPQIRQSSQHGSCPLTATAAVSQDTATLPARKGTFYPAETGQQFKWGNVITHT